tara:strand:- start:321 stop:605 length:285 start_codon:yes stop_codon:yes gene_type:complete
VVEVVAMVKHQVMVVEDLVVLVAAADMLVALDQVLELEHHSQELSEQHHLLDGDILDQTVMVLVVAVLVVGVNHWVLVVMLFNYHQHLEILHQP